MSSHRLHRAAGTDLVQVWPQPPVDYPRRHFSVTPISPLLMARATGDREMLRALDRPDLFEQLRETLAERREQRKAAFVSALVVASNAIVIGLAVVVAVLCVTKGWSW